MTDMRRWQASINYLYPVDDTTPLHPGRMEVYLASDAEAAIAAAEQECGERSEDYQLGYHHGWIEAIEIALDVMHKATEGPYRSIGLMKAEDAVRQLLDEARLP